MKTPPFLKPGDRFHIVSPAGKIYPGSLSGAIKIIENEGYKVTLGDCVYSDLNQFAGSDNDRLNDLQWALDNPDIQVILCSRGGYGTVRIMDRIDFSGFIQHPKWVVGYSDITALHSAIHNLGFASLHATMAKFLADDGKDSFLNLKSLLESLAGEGQEYAFLHNINNRYGTGTGELVGGNLSLLCSLTGTKYDINTDGKILFLEDIDEYLYHIDRMVHQLKLAGKFNSLKGLIIGDFSDIKDNDDPFGMTVHQIVSEIVQEYGFPVAFGFPAGHESKNLALMFGARWKLSVNTQGSELNFDKGIMQSEVL